MAPVIASSLAGVFIALAAVVMDSPVALLILAASAFCAYLSHIQAPLWLQLFGYFTSIGLGFVAWALLLSQAF